jgi:hypothetical protein
MNLYETLGKEVEGVDIFVFSGTPIKEDVATHF